MKIKKLSKIVMAYNLLVTIILIVSFFVPEIDKFLTNTSLLLLLFPILIWDINNIEAEINNEREYNFRSIILDKILLFQIIVVFLLLKTISLKFTFKILLIFTFLDYFLIILNYELTKLTSELKD